MPGAVQDGEAAVTYELRYNPEIPDGSDNTVLYEGDDGWPVSRRVETFGSLEEAMMSLAARGMTLGEERPVPPFLYGKTRYWNVSSWEVTA